MQNNAHLEVFDESYNISVNFIIKLSAGNNVMIWLVSTL